MKNLKYLFLILLSASLIVSCDKNEDEVIPKYTNIEITGEQKLDIPVSGVNWYIETVTDLSSDKAILDKELKPITLKGFGKIESDNHWLILERDNEEEFSVYLKENFNYKDRKIIICINDNGKREYIIVAQKRGESYKLVKTQFEEIEELRKIYVSDRDCQTLTFTNNTPQPIWHPSDYIFENVIRSSHFQSDDYGAFDWISADGIEIKVPDIMDDGAIVWSGYCLYNAGLLTEPYIKHDIAEGGKIKVEPHTTLYLRGEITYYERTCNYIFRIENETTGKQFKIEGVWSQVIPISPHYIIGDEPQ